MPLLRKAPKARVINVSSLAHMMGSINFENIHLRNGVYDQIKAYSQSKLANILFTRELAKRLGEKSSVTVYSLHPGSIMTEIARHGPLKELRYWFMHYICLTPEMGRQTTLYCALDDSLDNKSGFYYS